MFHFITILAMIFLFKQSKFPLQNQVSTIPLFFVLNLSDGHNFLLTTSFMFAIYERFLRIPVFHRLLF